MVELTRAMMLVLMDLRIVGGHGYQIMLGIIEITGGEYSVPAATLYRSLNSLLEHGLIREAPEMFQEGDDQRRKYYQITEAGVAALEAELRRLEVIIRRAHEFKIIAKDGGNS